MAGDVDGTRSRHSMNKEIVTERRLEEFQRMAEEKVVECDRKIREMDTV